MAARTIPRCSGRQATAAADRPVRVTDAVPSRLRNDRSGDRARPTGAESRHEAPPRDRPVAGGCSGAACPGRRHVEDGVISIRTEKTGEGVTICMEPALAAAIAAGPVGDLTVICGEHAGHRSATGAAPLVRPAGGPRKLTATTATETGTTFAALEAMCDWSGERMASSCTGHQSRAPRSVTRWKAGSAANKRSHSDGTGERWCGK